MQIYAQIVWIESCMLYFVRKENGRKIFSSIFSRNSFKQRMKKRMDAGELKGPPAPVLMPGICDFRSAI